MEPHAEVELANVSKRFGETSAVNSVSLLVSRGEFLTLLGPSGCGKTTLLRMIAGFEAPDSGTVLLGGRDVTALPPFKRDVTTVFQHYALFPHLTVFKNVAFGLERKHLENTEIRRRVSEALDLVRLNGLEARMPGELSGGQQQRVALARALVLEPRVLLLDEPLAALDLKLRKQMQTELKSLQRQLGISFIYVTHDQEEALTMSDRIVVMNGGKIEQTGDAREIYERPKTEFVAGFIGASNILAATLAGTSGDNAVVNLGGMTIEVSSAGAPTRLERGQPVRIMIRPEKIALSSAASRNGLQGRIESAVYVGDSTQWRIKTDEGQELVAVEQNRTSFGEGREIGQVVSVEFEPGSVVVLWS